MIDFDKRYLSKKTNVDLCFKIVDMSFEKASALAYLKPKKKIFVFENSATRSQSQLLWPSNCEAISNIDAHEIFELH